MRNTFLAVVYSIALLGCGGGDYSTTPEPSKTTTSAQPQDSWIAAELLIATFMDPADASLFSGFGVRFANTLSTLASQGLLNSDAAPMAFHADAEAEISQFIAVTHDFVWSVAVNNRIDEIGMTALMNDYKSRQLIVFNKYRYGLSSTVADSLISMISDTLDTAYSNEIHVMSQLG
jgi:hypothetical protein